MENYDEVKGFVKSKEGVSHEHIDGSRYYEVVQLVQYRDEKFISVFANNQIVTLSLGYFEHKGK